MKVQTGPRDVWFTINEGLFEPLKYATNPVDKSTIPMLSKKKRPSWA